MDVLNLEALLSSPEVENDTAPLWIVGRVLLLTGQGSATYPIKRAILPNQIKSILL